MSQSFNWYNSVLQVLIVNYRTWASKIKGSSSRTEMSEILNLIHTLKSDRIHVMFVSVSHWLYYLCKACFNLKKTMSNKRYRTHYKI